MKRAATFLLILLATITAGCSFGTDYVVVNSSGVTVQITYTIGPTGIDPLAATGQNVPGMLPVSQLSGRREWRKLAETEFLFDRGNRTVTVSLPPNQGLLINRGGEYSPNPPTIATPFIIEELRITGLNGEIVLKGDAVQKAFVVEPKTFYQFGPPTLLKLNYS